MSDYDLRCAAATTEQGLDPITAALDAAQIEHAVEQTGGFTMVVTIRRGGRVYAVTSEGEDGFLIGNYDTRVWEGEDVGRSVEATTRSIEVKTPADVVRYLSDRRRRS